MTGYMLTVTHGNETTVIQVFKPMVSRHEIKMALKRSGYRVRKNSVLVNSLHPTGTHTTKSGEVFRLKRVELEVTYEYW